MTYAQERIIQTSMFSLKKMLILIFFCTKKMIPPSVFSSVIIFVNKVLFQAILLSVLSFLLAAVLSAPLFFLAKLDVNKNIISEQVTSFCYEVCTFTALILYLSN